MHTGPEVSAIRTSEAGEFRHHRQRLLIWRPSIRLFPGVIPYPVKDFHPIEPVGECGRVAAEVVLLSRIGGSGAAEIETARKLAIILIVKQDALLLNDLSDCRIDIRVARGCLLNRSKESELALAARNLKFWTSDRWCVPQNQTRRGYRRYTQIFSSNVWYMRARTIRGFRGITGRR